MTPTEPRIGGEREGEMTVHIKHQTLVSDREVFTLRRLTEAATLTLESGDYDDARRNLESLMERLTAIDEGRAPRSPEHFWYGRVSIKKITLL